MSHDKNLNVLWVKINYVELCKLSTTRTVVFNGQKDE